MRKLHSRHYGAIVNQSRREERERREELFRLKSSKRKSGEDLGKMKCLDEEVRERNNIMEMERAVKHRLLLAEQVEVLSKFMAGFL